MVVRVCITLSEETKKKLDELAKKEIRTISNMIAYLVENYEEK
jgi:predicted transcriptional regulator